MEKNFVVLEKWSKGGFTNRLVTDGKTLRMEYTAKDMSRWAVDNTNAVNQNRFLKVFK